MIHSPSSGSNKTERQLECCCRRLKDNQHWKVREVYKWTDSSCIKCAGTMSLAGKKLYGLASTLCSQCTCGYENLKFSNKYTRWECNSAVSGCMGRDGYREWTLPLQNQWVGIPVMNKLCFQKNWNDMVEHKTIGSYARSWQRRKEIRKGKQWLPSRFTCYHHYSGWCVVQTIT